YLIGADHVPLLPKWRDADELARLVEFVVLPRPGEAAAPLPAPFRGRALAGFPLGVSSSQIRERVKAGSPIDLLAGPAVADALRPRAMDGTLQTAWVVLDFFDVIVHVMRADVREHYDLEGLWGDAPRVRPRKAARVSRKFN